MSDPTTIPLAIDESTRHLEETAMRKVAGLLEAVRDPSLAVDTMMGPGLEAIADLIAGSASSSARATAVELRQIQSRRGRSFAAPSVRRAVSEFYDTYLPPLVGNVSEALAVAVSKVLAGGDRSREDVRDTAGRLQDVLGAPASRARTIVRTEGTRAAMLARRALLQDALEDDAGPDWLVFYGILDSRVTNTCRQRHGYRWSPSDDRLEWWPPLHYQCRSTVMFLGPGDDPSPFPLLTRSAELELRLVQAAEFPGWVQQRDAGRIGDPVPLPLARPAFRPPPTISRPPAAIPALPDAERARLLEIRERLRERVGGPGVGSRINRRLR